MSVAPGYRAKALQAVQALPHRRHQLFAMPKARNANLRGHYSSFTGSLWDQGTLPLDNRRS